MPAGQSPSVAQEQTPKPGSTCPTPTQFGPLPFIAQSAEVRHDKHWWEVAPHSLASGFVQSMSVRQSTQRLVARSHTLGFGQSTLEEQRGTCGGQPGSAHGSKPLEPPLEPMLVSGSPSLMLRASPPPSLDPLMALPSGEPWVGRVVPPQWPSAIAAATSSDAIVVRGMFNRGPDHVFEATVVPHANRGRSRSWIAWRHGQRIAPGSQRRSHFPSGCGPSRLLTSSRHSNAAIPVISWPRIRVCMSCVPS
jgi:hypothetical protein